MNKQTILIIGGGIGGFAAALALSKQGFQIKVLEQASTIGEIGAGIQLGPNAFHAFDALGIGDAARKLAVYTDYMVMHDAVDEYEIGRIPTDKNFLKYFGNPYAVIHRADIHNCLVEGAKKGGNIQIITDCHIEKIEQTENNVQVYDQKGNKYEGIAAIGADGVKSVVRNQYVGDPALVTGHVVYRAVVPKDEFPENLRWNAASLWAGPNCHLVHYPLRGGEQYNVVVTFHSREQEQWGVTDGSKEEVLSYFQGICPKARQLIELPKSWRRWATADREPISQWTFGKVTLLGDAAHPTTQYMAQGACMAMEDAVTLGEALKLHQNNIELAFDTYQKARVTRTARIVLSSREMGKLYHAYGIRRMIRNDLWRGRSAEQFYKAVEWLYGWNKDNCLEAAKYYSR
ncbi:3-hydroxybenzoate 6-hydroxylase [Gallibacterium anatis]|uniref:3-hydroxybenzoate 6-hydroxylase n=1 Tax=Gallibacterium anatis TaxID=750 RepID=A0A377H3Y8_9PAST|nr:3-hydroxybenzoate 6-monooxygenase [Gallibacterium anatis]KGQ53891.1 salicylate hydroxylase [Gallibacterium anatis DSM 16844 = F 149]STO37169.1 3-hydroxybenzoate 6-hydroxylase [Gallibacterium anatis]